MLHPIAACVLDDDVFVLVHFLDPMGHSSRLPTHYPCPQHHSDGDLFFVILEPIA
jgi:hypothetical protein